MRSVRDTAQARELTLVVPQELDVYAMHQMVWEFASRCVAPGCRPTFLFRREGLLVRVRSAQFLPAGTAASQWIDGKPCRVDLAAYTHGDGGQRAIPAGRLHEWVSDKLDQAGFVVHDLQVQPGLRTGIKWQGAAPMHIVLPLARTTARLTIRDKTRAYASWLEGIGRAKRFGLGMLAQ